MRSLKFLSMITSLLLFLTLSGCGKVASDKQKNTDNSVAETEDKNKATPAKTDKTEITFTGKDTFKIAPDIGGADRFKVSGSTEKIVEDTTTGLIWQQNIIAGSLTWQEALEYGGFSNWRSPSIKELYSLVNIAKYDPASDLPGMITGNFGSLSSDVYFKRDA